MPDVWCSRCDKWARLPQSKLCEECAEQDRKHFVIGCVAIIGAIAGVALGFITHWF